MIRDGQNGRTPHRPLTVMNETSPEEQPESPSPPGEENAPVDNSSELSPEEQMAAFEEALKNSDWGHQPC